VDSDPAVRDVEPIVNPPIVPVVAVILPTTFKELAESSHSK
jgi:hypothetical protein